MLGELLDRQVLALERDGVSCRTGRGERDERSYRELAFLQGFDHLGADGAGRSDHRHGVQFFVLHAVYSNSKIEVLASFNTRVCRRITRRCSWCCDIAAVEDPRNAAPSGSHAARLWNPGNGWRVAGALSPMRISPRQASAEQSGARAAERQDPFAYGSNLFCRRNSTATSRAGRCSPSTW